MGVEEFLNIEEEHKREFSELLQYCLASGRDRSEPVSGI